MPIYYPAVAAALIIRFDESLLTGSEAPAPTTAKENAEAGGAPGGASDKGAMFGAKDRLSHELVIIPKTASVELPGYRQAPKFSMTFNFRDFPVDPRAIRAMSVEIFIGTLTGVNFGRGMLGQNDGGAVAEQLVTFDENLMMVGIVDNMTTSHSEKGSEVMIDGRGLQGMFLDAKIHADTLKALDLNQTIDNVVKQILGKDSLSKAIPVRVEASEWPNSEVPRPSAPELISRELKGQDGKKTKNPMKSDPNSVAVWDIITNFCNVCGAVPYFIGHELWIRPIKSLFDQKKGGSPGGGDTPFAGGKKRSIEVGKGKIDASFRKMVFGRNLLNFKLERKFGGAKVPMVECVSVDMSVDDPTKRLLIGQWPPKSEKQPPSAVSASGSEARTETLRIAQPGIIDVKRLESIARNIFNEVGRGELGGSASTKDLASLGGDNDDTDIIRLRPGDAIEFAVDAGGLAAFPPVMSELNSQAAASPAELSKSIQDRLGFSADLANVLVGTSRGKFAGLQDVFRVANVKYSWDIAAGIAVDFDFQNYITARYDFEKPGVTSEVKDIASAPAKSYGSASPGGGSKSLPQA